MTALSRSRALNRSQKARLRLVIWLAPLIALALLPSFQSAEADPASLELSSN